MPMKTYLLLNFVSNSIFIIDQLLEEIAKIPGVDCACKTFGPYNAIVETKECDATQATSITMEVEKILKNAKNKGLIRNLTINPLVSYK